MKKALGLLAICLLLFGCVGGDADADNQTNSSVFEGGAEINPDDLVPAGSEAEVGSGGSESPGAGIADGSPMWAGTFTVKIYGGGTEKNYDMTLTGADELYFDEEENAFDVLQSSYTCSHFQSSHVEMGEPYPPIDSSNTGSGSITKDYPEDEYRLYFESDGTITGDFSEPDEEWVAHNIVFNGESSSEDGWCLIDDFNDIWFQEGEFVDLTIDEQGRDSIRGSKKITYGTANAEITFEYHRVEE